eukprot:TRINITY_DN7988_c0_g1_i2.p1 TRINITY_DN7988_c0_g1~~TRINITY_DN7988_c0_g1_i2.p1  ORF type:complete len:210 (+),score=58.53 TRINITY_DN7988_c0_g1_i2:1026-1655(+)
MGTVQELKGALKETLENNGILDELRSRVRAEIYKALEDQENPKPQLSNENLIINELIREYLVFNKYAQTLSVFIPETGQPKESLSRKFLAREVRIQEDITTQPIPLLYTILSQLQQDPFQNTTQPTPTPRTEEEINGSNTNNNVSNINNVSSSGRGRVKENEVFGGFGESVKASSSKGLPRRKPASEDTIRDRGRGGADEDPPPFVFHT